jgi:hypothetical protein
MEEQKRAGPVTAWSRRAGCCGKRAVSRLPTGSPPDPWTSPSSAWPKSSYDLLNHFDIHRLPGAA